VLLFLTYDGDSRARAKLDEPGLDATIPAMKRITLVLFLTTFLTAQTAPEVEITAEPHHHLTFTNAQVRAFNINVSPHAETLMHWHRHDYIYVTLGDSEVVNAVRGKDPVTVKLRDGQTGFLPGAFAHVFRNLSARPFRNMTVELLQDDKLRHSPAHWDPAHPEQDRGLDVLEGGTKDILFVKDGVRVSEFELQPNAAVPARSSLHQLLLIAVTDLDIYTNDPGTHGPPARSSTPRHLNSGDSIWLPSGFGRPIVNASPHNAKFVTLEFK
jgi:hypothetical protein